MKDLTAKISEWEGSYSNSHAAGSLSIETIRSLQHLLPKNGTSIETGCGKSTILFSNISESHLVFSYDDRNLGERSSVNYFFKCPYTRLDSVRVIYGPTQKTLPGYEIPPLDAALIDGPHGFPFPELEYYFIYPHLKEGGILIIDDIHIPTIGLMHSILKEDPMFEPLMVLESKTAVLRRTDAPVFDPTGDGWWLQPYNRSRVDPALDRFLREMDL